MDEHYTAIGRSFLLFACGYRAYMTPRATYRLQFHPGFGFADAARIAPYLARLGISHVYSSPWLKARSGSYHGYDIVDHQALNPELGSQEDFNAMVAEFRKCGLRQIADFVPNRQWASADRKTGFGWMSSSGAGIRHMPDGSTSIGVRITSICRTNSLYPFSATSMASSCTEASSL